VTVKQRKIPMRKCVACQQMQPKKSLLRIVRTPERELLLDPTGKKSGRGAYLCPNTACVELAKKKRALEHALEVKVPAELYEEILRVAQGVQSNGP